MRKQIAFATLTEAELDQLADWLRHETYATVLERARKPRSEGGLGLTISRSPLERLHDKTNQVAKINAHLETGEKLTLAKFDAIITGDSAPSHERTREHSEKVHGAIMQATYEMATSGENTPAQLLSLQRLADFPARAEIREQRLELDHKKFDHKLEMDTFRKDMAEKRFDLAQKSFAFRQQQHQDFLNRASNNLPKPDPKKRREDALGPLIRRPEDIQARAERKFGNYSAPAPQLPTRAECQSPVLPNAPASEPQESAPSPSPSLLPQCSPVQSPEAASTASAAPENNHHGSRSDDLVQGNTLVAGMGGQSSIINNQSPPQSPEALSATTSKNLQSAICDLQSTVNTYTVRRAEEYWAYRRQYAAPPPPRKSHPQYITQYKHCPCGASSPCPIHESEETFGPFPDSFWTLSPHNMRYAQCLVDRGLPYREPTEFL